jgi:hypothetical protein
MTHLETWTYYYACYLPSVGYLLASLSMSFSQLDRVQRTAMQVIIAKCGYNRHTKREILYGPLEYGGASFRHLYVQQGIGQVTSFLRHWRQDSVTGKLLRCALAWIHMTAGVSQSILVDVHSEMPHLESKWIASLRQFLSKIDATIEVDDPGISPPQRIHDSYLMDHILQSKQFKPAQIRCLNYCRLYLQAVTVSDITTNAGLQLDLSKRKGHPSLVSSVTQYIRVHQDRPTDKEWRLWKKTNLLWSDVHGNLTTPFGSWMQTSQDQRQRHFAYQFGSRLALRMHTKYHIYKRKHHHYKSTGVIVSFEDLPSNAHATDAQYHPTTDTWSPKLHQYGPYVRPPPCRVPATFDEYIQTLDAWELDLLFHTRLSMDPFSVCDALAHGIRAVSDGSVRYNTQGSFGWVLSAQDGERTATGMGPAQRPNPASFRAEGYACQCILFTRLSRATIAMLQYGTSYRNHRYTVSI